MKPLDLREWLERLALTDDFAREALELVDNQPFHDECIEIREALEKEADPEKPKDIADYFISRSQLLDELKDVLEQAGFTGDTDDALAEALAALEEAKTELAALKAPALILPDGRELEYDL